MPGAAWVSANDTLKNLRMIKDAREVELLHEAGRRTDVAWEEFIQSPLSGLTETEAAGLIPNTLTSILKWLGLVP